LKKRKSKKHAKIIWIIESGGGKIDAGQEENLANGWRLKANNTAHCRPYGKVADKGKIGLGKLCSWHRMPVVSCKLQAA